MLRQNKNAAAKQKKPRQNKKRHGKTKKLWQSKKDTAKQRSCGKIKISRQKKHVLTQSGVLSMNISQYLLQVFHYVRKIILQPLIIVSTSRW